MDKINTANEHFVSVSGQQVVMLNPPTAPLSLERALVLAAWIVVLAETQAMITGQPMAFTFKEAKHAVQNT